MLLEHERNHALGMDALVTVSSWKTNGSMVWAWMLWSPYVARNYAMGMDALVTACSWNTNGSMVWAWILFSRHGCTGHRMLSEHERNYGLGMDALITSCPHAPQDEAAGSTWRHTFPYVPCASLWPRCMCISCISCASICGQ